MKFFLSLWVSVSTLLLIGCWLAEVKSPTVAKVEQPFATAPEAELAPTSLPPADALQPASTTNETPPSADAVLVAEAQQRSTTALEKVPPMFGSPMDQMSAATALDADGLPFVPVSVNEAFVVEIVYVPPGNWTNGHPPTLQINVIDALGSSVPLGPTTYQWDETYMLLCGVGAEKEIALWNALPLTPPNKGSRWIVYGKNPYGGRWPDSDAMRKKVRESLKRNARIAETRKREEEVAKATSEARSREKRQTWDQAMTSDKLAKWARTADLVVVAKAALVSETPLFTLSKVLKGVYRKRGQQVIAVRDIVKQVGTVDSLWTEQEEVILFLSEQLVVDHSFYEVEPVGAGIVLHNTQREKLVVGECIKSAKKTPGAIVVSGHAHVQRVFASKFPVRPMILSPSYGFDPAVGEKYEKVDWIIGMEIQRVDAPMVVYVQKTSEKEPRKSEPIAGNIEEQIEQAHEFVLSVINK